jgi:hypothetical protein
VAVFRGLINDAKSAAGAMVAKYAARVSVAVPFLVAVGFATAAVTLMLVERFGAINAYWMVAGGFTGIGLVATFVVGMKEQEEEVADAEAEKADTAAVATDAAAQAAVHMPIALLGTLLTSSAGPVSAVGIARMIGRNLPLVILLALIALMFWPTAKTEGVGAVPEEDEEPTVRPNGAHPPASAGFAGEAA